MVYLSGYMKNPCEFTAFCRYRPVGLNHIKEAYFASGSLSLTAGGADEIWTISSNSYIAALGMGFVLSPIPCGERVDPLAAAVRDRFFYRSSTDERQNSMTHSS
jgi:hypothetical protein